MCLTTVGCPIFYVCVLFVCVLSVVKQTNKEIDKEEQGN